MAKWGLMMMFLVLLATGMLTGCALGDISLPTTLDIPNIDLRNEPVETPQSVVTPDESPRKGPSINLPPTWTPISPTGQEVAVPTQRQPVGSDFRSYIVQAGDTLAEIAIRFGVTMDEIAQANNISDLDHIEVGQELLIPSR